jgi:hypothetical protein
MVAGQDTARQSSGTGRTTVVVSTHQPQLSAAETKARAARTTSKMSVKAVRSNICDEEWGCNAVNGTSSGGNGFDGVCKVNYGAWLLGACDGGAATNRSR